MIRQKTKKKIRLNKLIVCLILLLLFFAKNALPKNYDGKLFICADEIGPRFELQIPNFVDEIIEENISIKIYEISNRENFVSSNATIQKKTSPIDNSYFFYSVEFNKKKGDGNLGYFELYPPSHLMLKNQGISFSSLVCW